MTYEYSTDELMIELMGRIVNKLRRLADARLKPIGLTFPQYGTLFTLMSYRETSLSQRELAEVMKTDTTTIMVICDALMEKGYLTRTADLSDRRVNRVGITPKGQRSVDKALPAIRGIFGPVLSVLSDEEKTTLASFLEKMSGAASGLK